MQEILIRLATMLIQTCHSLLALKAIKRLRVSASVSYCRKSSIRLENWVFAKPTQDTTECTTHFLCFCFILDTVQVPFFPIYYEIRWNCNWLILPYIFKWIERLCLLREKWATFFIIFFIVPALNIHPALSIQLCEEIFSYVIATVYGFSIDNCLLYLHFHPQIGAKTKGIAIFTQIETPSKPFLSLSAEQWGNLFQFFRWLRWCTAHQTKNCAFHGCSLMGILDEVRWRSHQLRYSVAPKRSPRGKIRGRYAS